MMALGPNQTGFDSDRLDGLVVSVLGRDERLSTEQFEDRRVVGIGRSRFHRLVARADPGWKSGGGSKSTGRIR